MTFLLISFMRSGDFKTVILAIVAAVFGVSIVLRFKSYVLDRFKAWGHAWEYANDLGYQQTHVLTYIASGGLFGVGIGNGFLKGVGASESDLVFLPLTGVTFPFISCGGSSVLSCWGLIAFIKAADERTYAVKK